MTTKFNNEFRRLCEIFKYPPIEIYNPATTFINKSFLKLSVAKNELHVCRLTQFALDCMILAHIYYPNTITERTSRSEFILCKLLNKFGDIYDWRCYIGNESPNSFSSKYISFNVNNEQIFIFAKKRNEHLPFLINKSTVLEPWVFENGAVYQIGIFNFKVINNEMEPVDAQFAFDSAILANISFTDDQDQLAMLITKRFWLEFGNTSWVCIIGDSSCYGKYQPKMFIKFIINDLTVTIFKVISTNFNEQKLLLHI